MLTFDQEIPVTMVITQTIKPDLTNRFEAWLHQVAADAMGYPGHLGVHVIRPSSGSSEYTTIFRFGTAQQLRAWIESDVRARRLREGRDFFVADARAQQLSGLETWFALPSQPAKMPPKYKMALVTIAAVFSLLMIIPRLTAPLLGLLPAILRTLVVCATMVLLLTYAVMPLATRALSRWLYSR